MEKLKDFFLEAGSTIIAYSGGVDSTFLLKVAADVLKDKLLAVTARSPLHPEREYSKAKKEARKLGVKFLSIATDELSLKEFIDNPPERCYWCKRELFGKLLEIAGQEDIKCVVDGSNLDDLEDFRPGRKAAEEMGIESPLCKVGLTKKEIRILSRELGLSTWNKPSFACLASRIPYGVPINQEILEVVNRAEEFLLSLGVGQLRVRHHGETARIEVEPTDMEKIINHREKILEIFRSLGYLYIVLDLGGYRSGSMNRIIQG
ncbi:MAG TPA: ATP-dependent sacrificial sulfur transferase LarE [Desulfatiglandales bacterium]|nr:ATP-dependent sacrificial sulfur transferase LarE [Desulfatiglandales bacterium]